MDQDILDYWKDKCRLKLEELVNFYIKSTREVFIFPKLKFDAKGSKAGEARWPSNIIRLNPILLYQNKQHFVDNVVGHELAHIIVMKKYGINRDIKPHGKEWCEVMMYLGLDPNVYHTYKVDKDRFLYRCSCRDHYLTLTRHNKVNRNGLIYICKVCKGHLKFVNE